MSTSAPLLYLSLFFTRYRDEYYWCLAATRVVTVLADAGVLEEEISGRKRDRSFGCVSNLDLLKVGTSLER